MKKEYYLGNIENKDVADSLGQLQLLYNTIDLYKVVNFKLKCEFPIEACRGEHEMLVSTLRVFLSSLLMLMQDQGIFVVGEHAKDVEDKIVITISISVPSENAISAIKTLVREIDILVADWEVCSVSEEYSDPREEVKGYIKLFAPESKLLQNATDMNVVEHALALFYYLLDLGAKLSFIFENGKD